MRDKLAYEWGIPIAISLLAVGARYCINADRASFTGIIRAAFAARLAQSVCSIQGLNTLNFFCINNLRRALAARLAFPSLRTSCGSFSYSA